MKTATAVACLVKVALFGSAWLQARQLRKFYFPSFILHPKHGDRALAQ